MGQKEDKKLIIEPHDLILITGTAGFIGSRVLENLLDRGFRSLRCFTRSAKSAARLEALAHQYQGTRFEVLQGNLLSPDDCRMATKDAAVIFHLAAGRGEKMVPDAFLNSVVTTRNLLEACSRQQCLRRFVNVSSFAVYTNTRKARWRMLDESCPVEAHPDRRGDAYAFAKVRQDELVMDYGKQVGIPYVIVRPGYVYGPGNTGISGRVGTGAFGLYLHLGGSNPIPLTYVENCAEAIVLAGLRGGIDGEVFNVVDDDLISSRKFLRLFKKHVTPFKSIYVPKVASYLLCYMWERYSAWSQGQLPLAYNRKVWHAQWKKTHYSNRKLKTHLGWAPKVSTEEGLRRFFAACRAGGVNA